MKPILTICIPTVVGRERLYQQLLAFIENQCMPYGEQIEILTIKDNKEISIGAKRQKMYKQAKGLYSWQVDDDDLIAHDAIDLIMEAAKQKADCITFKERCIFANRVETSNFSNKYLDWGEAQDGYDHVRTPFCKTPIKTALCLKAGVKDLRYGEDHEFARDVKKYLKTEVHIDEFIYIYRYKYEDSATKYGIKQNLIK